METRRHHWEELKTVLAEALATRTADEWLSLMGELLPIAPVNDIGQAFADPQVLHRNMLVETEHPVAGHYRMPGNPIKLGQKETFLPAPTLGQHNQEVLGGLLGYSTRDIENLREQGVV